MDGGKPLYRTPLNSTVPADLGGTVSFQALSIVRCRDLPASLPLSLCAHLVESIWIEHLRPQNCWKAERIQELCLWKCWKCSSIEAECVWGTAVNMGLET